MTLEQQVCSLDLAKKLKELGVKQESLFYWVRKGNQAKYILKRFAPGHDRPVWKDSYSAFTVSEAGNLLPKAVYGLNKADVWSLRLPNDNTDIFIAKTEADARAKMLIYLLENKLVN